MRRRSCLAGILILVAVLLAGALGIYYLPPVHSRLAWRLDQLWNSIRLAFSPPDEAVFVPGQGAGTAPALPPNDTPPPPTATAHPLTPTATALPASVRLAGVVYVDQHNRWNYCGPANLAMALEYWGWRGQPGSTVDPRDQIAFVVRPGRNDPSVDFIQRGRTDLNVMPEELEYFANEHTEFRALQRYGGDIDLIRRMVAAGFPLVVEKGYVAHDTTGALSWMGHYEFVTGYDPGSLLVQDAYDFGPDHSIPDDEFVEGWRAFDYLFMVVYPPERQDEVLAGLGPWADPTSASQIALQTAQQETRSLSGLDLFFAWFNLGTSQASLGQYAEASSSYDRAFQLYAELDAVIPYRPYRLLWYQNGPYEAYYLMGRFQDVIDLADNSLSTPLTGPTLEEALYWRALAEYALGETDAAFADMRQAVYLNPNFRWALDKLQDWGISP
jgi:tetratricopeptide (TPR) repeat protein